MELASFKEYLHEKKLDSEKIDAAVNIVRDFDEFLSKTEKSVETATYDDLHNFSAHLIEKSQNSFDNYVALLRFGYFQKNKPLIIASMELVDGSEMIANFSQRLIEEFGEKVRDEIFGDSPIPPLGLHPKTKPEITKKLVERLLAKVGQEKAKEFLAVGLRDKYTESYKQARETFLQTENIDDFLKIKYQKLLKTLDQHLQDGSLFFTQAVDESVMAHVQNDPTIEAGVREGNQVVITKIPYMAKQYLETTKEREKRYFFCHCPWVREALLEEDQPIDPIFCHMSGGYYKNYWEAVLDHPVKVELLESVIRGDAVCKFALQLPPEFVPE
ncbi:MAG: hypothetical protein ACE5OZ_18025 [Candidatus Heimdallarchaeota archaeon]